MKIGKGGHIVIMWIRNYYIHIKNKKSVWSNAEIQALAVDSFFVIHDCYVLVGLADLLLCKYSLILKSAASGFASNRLL